jgi:hypothetical protein
MSTTKGCSYCGARKQSYRKGHSSVHTFCWNTRSPLYCCTRDSAVDPVPDPCRQWWRPHRLPRPWFELYRRKRRYRRRRHSPSFQKSQDLRQNRQYSRRDLMAPTAAAEKEWAWWPDKWDRKCWMLTIRRHSSSALLSRSTRWQCWDHLQSK